MNKSFYEKYEKLLRDFWWGDEEGHRKVHWMSWEQMVKPKRGGGIGFRDMMSFNQALLARQGWRLLQYPDSLCARVLKSKYYPNGELLDTVFATDASPVWRGIEFGLELLKEGVIWRIGDGRKIRIQRDNWIPKLNGLKAATFIRNSRLRWVNQLIKPDTNEWNSELIHQIFPLYDAEAICRIKLPTRRSTDIIAWHHENTGIFSVRSAYKLAEEIKVRDKAQASSSSGSANNRSSWDLIWNSKIPQKIKINAWGIAINSLATIKNKVRRILGKIATCTICGQEDEDEFHAMVACTKAKALRREMRKVWALPTEKEFGYTGRDWLQCLLAKCDEATRETLMLLF